MENSFEDLGFAKLDLSRRARTGIDEVVFCPGKTEAQLLSIFQTFASRKINALGTRCSETQYLHLLEAGLSVNYDACSKIISLKNAPANALPGRIAICCAGTGDLPIAEEASQVAEFCGAIVDRYYDVGIAGLHRLLSKIDSIRKANVIIAIAGMEGALAGVLSGLTSAPVIGVPTSIGYGASLGGISPLLTMLNTCAEGVSVVNIDNGFGAAIQACRILRQIKFSDIKNSETAE